MYEYVCPLCGPFLTSHRDSTHKCPTCGFVARRRWSFTVATSFQPHYSPSSGTYVPNRTALLDDFARADQSAHDRGLPEQHLVPVDIRDKEALGVTNEGLDKTYDSLKARGLDTQADTLKKAMGE